MIGIWNKHMAENWKSGLFVCIDESMSIWFNKWTCPGWMFVPRKPHPFGNEYHTRACGETAVIDCVDLVEGKDEPHTYNQQRHEPLGKTVGLLKRMCQSIFGTGRIIILDSGFCVLAGLIELRKMGLYASAVIKKRKYWPKYIPGNKIDSHLDGKDIGTQDVATGFLDGISYNVFAMKEPGYVLKLMSTYGDFSVPIGQEKTKRTHETNGMMSIITFFMTRVFSSHYKYRHAVDDNNNLRHSTPSIEGSWITHRWADRVFAFLLAVTEVNAYICFRYFIWKPLKRKCVPSIHEFRRRLAYLMIYNRHIVKEATVSDRVMKKQRLNRSHTKETAPDYAMKFEGYNEDGEIRWKKSKTDKYPQRRCNGACSCKARVRTFCSCSPGRWLCSKCHHTHAMDEKELAMMKEQDNGWL